MGCGLIVGVLILYPERSSSSDNPSKTSVVYVILPIIVTWRGVDEPTPETPFFIKEKKKNCVAELLVFNISEKKKVMHIFNEIT